MSKQDLREIFDAYTHPHNDFSGLLNVLGTVQKDFGEHWKEHVIACMYGMECHDHGAFPDEWLDELPDEDDSFEAYNNVRMTGKA